MLNLSKQKAPHRLGNRRGHVGLGWVGLHLECALNTLWEVLVGVAYRACH